jgi:thioredoxin 2
MEVVPMTKESIIIKCKKCGTKNRIPGNRILDNPKCGKCASLIMEEHVYNHPVVVNDQSFNKEIIEYRGSVLLDCWAPWCGPCRMITPVLEELAKTYAGQIKIAKLNVDENQQTASKYSIQSIPTLLLFKNGELVNTLLGALPKAQIEQHILTIL